jgi:hypothetical protein
LEYITEYGTLRRFCSSWFVEESFKSAFSFALKAGCFANKGCGFVKKVGSKLFFVNNIIYQKLTVASF